jgi:uncharacterized membrane protein
MTSDATIRVLLLAHAAATLGMAGVIWFVQLVHYPLMASVGTEGFAAYERAHTRLTSFVVAPLMLVELATGIALALGVAADDTVQWRLGLVLLALVWLSTFALQVPQHARLARGFDAHAHARLVATNWIRTVLWTARGGIVLWSLATLLRFR